MRQILNDIKSLSVSETCPDKLCSHSEKEATELNSSFDQDKQVKTTDTKSSLNPPELFYDIQAKNFGADKVGDILDENYLTKDILISYRVCQLYAQYAFELII